MRRLSTHIRHSATLCIAIVAAAAASAAPSAAGKTPHGAPSCPAYRPHMLDARQDLVRGDRAKAIEDLELARAALQACEQSHPRNRGALAVAIQPAKL